VRIGPAGVATERPNLATSGINIASMNACTLLAQSPQTTGYGRQERVKSGSRPITLRDDGTTASNVNRASDSTGPP